MSIRDEVLERVNRWSRENSPATYRVQIPRTIDDQLERIEHDDLLNLEKHFEVLAQLAAEAASVDPVWERLKLPGSGLFRLDAGRFLVFFKVDHPNRVVLVSHISSESAHGP